MAAAAGRQEQGLQSLLPNLKLVHNPLWLLYWRMSREFGGTEQRLASLHVVSAICVRHTVCLAQAVRRRPREGEPATLVAAEQLLRIFQTRKPQTPHADVSEICSN